MPNDDPKETITLGAGCFWCLDAVARRIPGILSSRVGYAGGEGKPPTYWDLHMGRARGFVESVELTFDTRVLNLEDVLQLFFASHDPTTPNQDGANHGPEYHSTIFYRSEKQREVAEREIDELEQRLTRPVVTSLREFSTFHEAEPEHQDFYNANPRSPYCRVIIEPKLKKLGLDKGPRSLAHRPASKA